MYSRDINFATDDTIPKDDCDSPDTKPLDLLVLVFGVVFVVFFFNFKTLMCDIIDFAHRLTSPGILLWHSDLFEVFLG